MQKRLALFNRASRIRAWLGIGLNQIGAKAQVYIMAKQGKKLDQMAVELIAESMSVVFKYQLRKDDDSWETKKEKAFGYSQIPAAMQAQLSLYGLRALLLDRVSQHRSSGVEACMELMQPQYDALVAGNWKTSGASRGKAAQAVDLVLLEILAAAKKAPLAVVAAQWEKLDKDTQSKIAEKYADQVAKAKAEADATVIDWGV